MFFFNNALLNSVYLSACVFLPVNFFPLLVSFISSFTFLPTCRVRMPMLRMLLFLLSTCFLFH